MFNVHIKSIHLMYKSKPRSSKKNLECGHDAATNNGNTTPQLSFALHTRQKIEILLK